MPNMAYRMRPDNRMLRLNRVASCNTPSGHATVHLFNSRVHRAQAMQSLLELRRQPVVRLGHVAEQRVTTARGSIEDIQERGARGLLLESHIRVPSDRVGAGGQELGAASVLSTTVHEVDLWVALGGTRGLVDVVTAEVAAKLEGLVDGEMGKVLVAEGWCIPISIILK